MIDNQQRAKFAQIMLLISGAVYVIILIILFFEIDLLTDIQTGSFDQSRAETNKSIKELATMIEGSASILTIIAFLAWIHRAYKNLSRAGISTSNSGNMAIWAWFIPIFNLFLPNSIVKEIWEQTQLVPFSEEERTSVSLKSSNFCNYWWGFFMASNIIGHIPNLIFRNWISLEIRITADYFAIISSLFSIVAAGLGFMVVRMIAEFEEEAIISAQINQIGVEVQDAS